MQGAWSLRSATQKTQPANPLRVDSHDASLHSYTPRSKPAPSPRPGANVTILRIVCAGWQYPHWLGTFLSRTQMAEYYARYFTTVEVNGTFYRLRTHGGP
jgi:hypothetical protein